jgi:Cu+-exporting ATPase
LQKPNDGYIEEGVEMIRRQFIQLVTFAGANSLTALAGARSDETKTVIYRVKGFSCATCAVGLDAMLNQHRGILRSKSTYPEGVVTIDFNPGIITEKSIKDFIAEVGFTIEN